MELPKERNPLGEERVGNLLKQFAVPSIIAMLVSSLYNIVDQFFIGQKIKELGILDDQKVADLRNEGPRHESY